MTADATPKPDPYAPMRRPDGSFLPGASKLQPVGRPKGSLGGRANALKMLDAILNEHQVKKAMEAAMRDAALKNPMKFFKEVVMPLLPQDMKIQLGGEEGTVQWVSLSTMFPMKPSEPSTAPVIDVSASSAAAADGEKPKALPPNS